MSVRLRDVLGRHLGELRYEPTAKRIRAKLGEETIVDSDRAMLVWEPRRVVPAYAVPAEDIRAELVACVAPPPAESGTPVGFALPDVTSLPVLDPRVPFGVRSTEGEPVELRVRGGDRSVSGFRPSEPDLSGYVIVDFAGLDTWLEEDDEILSHPRDPFHRVDARSTSRHVQVMLDGQVVADTTRARMVFETLLPVRYYIPREDVLADLEPSPKRTYCAYKGEASYWSPDVGGRAVEDLIWGYLEPLPDAAELKGYVAFFDEKTDLVLDGTARDRPITPWS